MDLQAVVVCPKCGGKNFEVKREVTYVYSYKFSSEGLDKTVDIAEELPFLFDNRDKCGSHEYIICQGCRSEFPISLEEYHKNIDLTILRKAVRSDHTENPEFLG